MRLNLKKYASISFHFEKVCPNGIKWYVQEPAFPPNTLDSRCNKKCEVNKVVNAKSFRIFDRYDSI